MTDPSPTDSDPTPARLRRLDHWLVCGIGMALVGLGLLGIAGVLWSRHAIDIGPGDPTLPIICLVVGAAVIALGTTRLR